MAAPTFKKMIITEGITIQSFGNEKPKCNFTGCTDKAAFKIECGNEVFYACKAHLEEMKLVISADESIDDSARVCSQDGPKDLNTKQLNTPAF